MDHVITIADILWVGGIGLAIAIPIGIIFGY